MARADYHTAAEEEDIFYSDIPMNMDLNPITGLLAVVTNEAAVKMALRNLILTSMGEVLYDPYMGSKVAGALHGPGNAITAELIRTTIKNATNAFEPRADIIDVLVETTPDGYTFNVSVYYRVINITDVQTLEVTLKRIR